MTGDQFGPPQCTYCGEDGGDDQWMRLVYTHMGLVHDGCLGDIEHDRAQAAEGGNRG